MGGVFVIIMGLLYRPGRHTGLCSSWVEAGDPVCTLSLDIAITEKKSFLLDSKPHNIGDVSGVFPWWEYLRRCLPKLAVFPSAQTGLQENHSTIYLGNSKRAYCAKL